MKIRNHFILALLFAGMVSSIAHAEQYLCTERQGIGFVFRNGQWQPSQFHTGTRFFYIKQPRADDDHPYADYPYIVSEAGVEEAVGWCENRFSTTSEIDCESPRGSILFNRANNRFIRTYNLGYTSGFDDNRDRPNMVIGECVPY